MTNEGNGLNLTQNNLTHSMLSLLEDTLRNKKKNKEETAFQWKLLPSWTTLRSNSKKKISSVSEGTQNDMNWENGQLLRKSTVNYTKESANINPTPLILSRRYMRSLKPLVFKLKWQQKSLNNSNMSSNRPSIWTKLEGLSTGQQSRANAWQSLDSLEPRTKNELQKLRNGCTQRPRKLDSSKSSCKDKQQTATDPEAVETTMATMEDHVDTEEEEEALFFWRTGLEWRPQHVTQYSEHQQQPKQQQYSTSAINHVNEESTKQKIDVQHYSTPSDCIKPGGRLQRFIKNGLKQLPINGLCR
ncbi:hypothetical protein G6F47_010387 [Rhizopus delemar]|uniref:Uncharacterized protein n=1 Tax=Rhizopus delemar (strain RA 99-880 / ATCC MYA-4621 / FGSC 9543 / NRRL 43880) TaxID=246409 RepID=I1CAJ0_RHIO9|nr:hypothetical protein RO3G_10180 [Rhizopus delemar RA 99-880]KAG1495032.1 hypothetical protein G6F54_007460 [Rhizopus delemar]KAG1509120.1 hypothetical protein G6F53_007684 [Rhizopus delemar]KAG1589317.1 hypothetical protein G6F47_010387 [Rhizopus delemar]|eukprot:EIE85470.1 hypothetical protein RO3G_10180 [Rhizopus delemar RA 99-880]